MTVKNRLKTVAILTVIFLCVSTFSGVAALPLVLDDGENLSFYDDFSEYKNAGTETSPVYNFSKNWTAHIADASHPPVIATDAPDNDGEKWMKLWALGYWTNLTRYAGVGTDAVFPADSEQTVSVRVRRTNGGQTAALRFLDDGKGNWFQLTMPRPGSSINYFQSAEIMDFVKNKYAPQLGVSSSDVSSVNVSNFYTAWILSQNTVKDGVTTHKIIDVYEDPAICLDAVNKTVSTSDVTIKPGDGSANYDQIITVKTTKETGEITVDINSASIGDNVYLSNDKSADVKKTFYNTEFKNSDINLCGIKLLARGQNGMYTYFTDVSVKSTRFPSLITKIYEDDFSAYGDVPNAQCPPSVILKDSNGNKINWKSYPKYMGFAQAENGVMVNYARVGIPAVAAGFNAPALSIEGRASTSDKVRYPTVVYTGNYPETEGYHIKFRVRPGQCVGGIRIATDDTFTNYYEILLQAHSGIGIYKITDNNPSQYTTLAFCNKESDIVKQHAGYSVPGSANIYDCELYISNGEIKFKANVLANPHHWTMDWMTVSDTDMPLDIENAKIAFCAAGNMNTYVLFTDFSIESYDCWVNDKKEPTSVLYYNIAKYKKSDKNGIIVLDNPSVIRRVKTDINGDISLSKDGKTFYALGTGTDVINTKSAAKFKFVKVPVGAQAKVYTNADGKIISVPLNTNQEFISVYNGQDVDTPKTAVFDDGASGSVAKFENGMVKINDKPVTAKIFKFIDVSGNVPSLFTQAVKVAVESPFKAMQKDGNLYVEMYVGEKQISENARAIVAFADGKNKLIGVEYADVQASSGVVRFEVKDAANAERATAMLWSKSVGGYPISESYRIR